MICKGCGAAVTEDMDFCGVCGTAVPKMRATFETPNYQNNQSNTRNGYSNNYQGYNTPNMDTIRNGAAGAFNAGAAAASSAYNAAQNAYQSRVNTARNNLLNGNSLDSIVLAEGEQRVKVYHCNSVASPKCEGYMMVTNKRLIYHASGSGFSLEPSRIVKEIAIDKITGISTLSGKNWNIFLLIFGILLILAALVAMFNDAVGAGIVVLIIAVLILLCSSRKTFKVTVYGGDTAPSPISVGEGATSIFGNSAAYAVGSVPAADAVPMMNELGAIIHDIQSLGDAAIAKWQA